VEEVVLSKLILITGTGRSGTSTMSGTFDQLGLHVPGPYLGANESNPKGFFESKWAVRFHKRIAAASGVNDFDSRPDAFALAQTGVTDELREELRDFLTLESRDHDQVVVKDPRSVWVQDVWREAAEQVGLDIRFISMLRHPAEVIGSRTTYYANPEDVDAQRSYGTFNVARWVNSSLVSERETRGRHRAFVSYVDLLTDWRAVLTGLAEDLGLYYNVDVAGGEASGVDDFIDPDLRRHQVTWDDLEVPEELRSVAQAIWDDLLLLQAGHGMDPKASADLDTQAARYAEICRTAADISHDALESERRRLRELTEKSRPAERQAKAARAGSGSQPPRRPARPTPQQRSADDLPVAQVGSRDLLRVVARRLRTKLARR
jgi:hypothetical protein